MCSEQLLKAHSRIPCTLHMKIVKLQLPCVSIVKIVKPQLVLLCGREVTSCFKMKAECMFGSTFTEAEIDSTGVELILTCSNVLE